MHQHKRTNLANVYLIWQQMTSITSNIFIGFYKSIKEILRHPGARNWPCTPERKKFHHFLIFSWHHISTQAYFSDTIFIQHHIYSIFQPICHQINWCKRGSWFFWPSCSLLELPGLIYDWPIPCQWRTLFANETRSALEYFYICCFILPRFSPPAVL